MASGYRNALPFLSEEDVPGVCFIHIKVEKHSVDQLRRWLACRGIKKSWNKTALSERKALKSSDQHCFVRTHAFAKTFVYPISNRSRPTRFQLG